MIKFANAMQLVKKRSKLYSILKLKCPKCREGNLFLTKNPYDLKNFDKMPKRCPVCGTDFERESGFYWGAMMISHANTTALAVIVHLIIHHYYGWQPLPFLIVFLILLIALITIIFRTSRAIWINFFVKYDSNFKRVEAKKEKKD